jgi:hypothetical protein
MMGYLCEFQCGHNLSATDKKTGQCLAGRARRGEQLICGASTGPRRKSFYIGCQDVASYRESRVSGTPRVRVSITGALEWIVRWSLSSGAFARPGGDDGGNVVRRHNFEFSRAYAHSKKRT